MPLALAPIGVMLKIVRVLLDDKTKKHLESLGILLNGQIEVISNGNDGVVVLVKETRLALDKNISSKILVA
ncbi:MAG TPA: ferrous iron transport protein A [Firmicutes bacterium]|nr:ferrous iron transport protein A [Bacillota bacterium]